MAAVLKLVEDGVDKVDFVGSTSDYSLRQNGLNIGLPDVERVVGGDPMLGEGQRLIERRYGNREVTITFNVRASNHNGLVLDMRAVNRLLDAAVRNAKEGIGKRIALHYKLDDADDEVVFDVLDGSFTPGQLASPTVRRGSSLLDCTLTLICEPYARLENPVEIRNLLRNGGFEIPEQGQEHGARYMCDLGTGTTKYLSRASAAGLYSDQMAAGLWIYWPSQQSAQAVLMQCGDNGTERWRLQINSSNKVELTVWDSTPTAYTITATDALSTGYHFIGFAIWTDDGDDEIAVLMVDRDVVGADRQDGKTWRTPTGGFYIGRGSAASLHFDGMETHPFVIAGTSNSGIRPFQLEYIRRWGCAGFSILGSENVPDSHYWGLEKADLGGVWTMTVGGTENLDYSGNARHLTENGSPAYEFTHPAPEGWTKGADYGDGDLNHGLQPTAKHGCRSFRLSATLGVADFHIQQTVDNLTSGLWYTLIFWYRPSVANETAFKVTWGASTQTIDAGNSAVGQWRQYVWTKAATGTSETVKLLWDDTGNDVDVAIDSIELILGEPFGRYTTPTDVTDSPLPYVGSSNIRAWPSGEYVNFLDVYDLPGDAPATCRLRMENTSGGQLAPLRVGAQFGGEPWKHINELRACLMMPVVTVGSWYDTGNNPAIVCLPIGQTLIVRGARAPLPALFPFLAEQHGSFKVYIGGTDFECVSIAMLETAISTVPLTGDPQEDLSDSSTEIHPIDGGILSWPPATAPSRVRAGEMTSGERYVATHKPALGIGNYNNVASTPEYTHLWLVPIDGGTVTLQVFTSSLQGSLLEDEVLVVDTIDEDASQVGYIDKEYNLPYDPARMTRLSAAGLSIHGTGFYVPPGEPGHFYFLITSLASGYVFGDFAEDDTLEVTLEYMPRFLYV